MREMTKGDKQLFWSLVLWSLVPSIYLLIRMHIVAITATDINVLGQMEWFDLIDEVLTTTLTIPLYYVLKEHASPQKNLHASLAAFAIYTGFVVVVAILLPHLVVFMNPTSAEKSLSTISQYLRLQTISLLIGFWSSLMVILFTLDGRANLFRILLLCKIAGMILCDFLFIPQWKAIGAVYSDIAGNCITAIIATVLAVHYKLVSTGTVTDKSDHWVIKWLKTGLFAGVQIFLDNFIYAVIVVRMVNAVSESGVYWTANNFIYGWLLVPVAAMTEIIKRNLYTKLDIRNAWKPMIYIYLFWGVSAMFWKPFIHHGMAMNIKQTDEIMHIIIPMMIFYLFYVPCQFIDGWFISYGKTWECSIISIIVNIVYYGLVYILFKRGVFPLGMPFIICMFGGGMVVHMLLSLWLYHRELSIIKQREKQTNAEN